MMKEWKEVIKYGIGNTEYIEELDFEYMDEVTEIPVSAGVYMFFSGHDIIYIGETSNLGRRIRSHMRGNSTSQKFMNEWTHIRYVNVPFSKNKRGFVESLLIDKYDPKYNTTDLKRLVAVHGDKETVYDLVYYARITKLDYTYIAEEFGIKRTTAIHFGSGTKAGNITLPKDYSPRKKLDMTRKRRGFTQLSKKKFYEIYDFLQVTDLSMAKVAGIFDVGVSNITNVKNLNTKKYKRWIQERLEETATV
ncbi:GIY-YIG nuclease family protein [Priestia aryabhattai]|uniref:GIY-YIG nuclease family protein n=1 Tax=Priestia aryabhattai TaxID=412384 RepID=UPI003D2CF65F